jgi:hypothetical protein
MASASNLYSRRIGRHASEVCPVALAPPPWVKTFPYNDHPKSEMTAIMVVEQRNPEQCYRISWDAILTVHRVVGSASRAGKIGGSVNAAAFRPVGAL